MCFSLQGTDVHIIIDAIASVMMLEEKEACVTGELAIAIMRETASIIMTDLYKVQTSLQLFVVCHIDGYNSFTCILQALQLPIFEYLVEKLCECCYERAWFAKAGGYVFNNQNVPHALKY